MKKKKLVSFFLLPLTFLIFSTSIALAANSIWYATWFVRIHCKLYNSSSSTVQTTVSYQASHITSGATRTYFSKNVSVGSKKSVPTERRDWSTSGWMKRFVVPSPSVTPTNIGQSM